MAQPAGRAAPEAAAPGKLPDAAAAPALPSIVVEGISKTFRRAATLTHALAEVSFSVGPAFAFQRTSPCAHLPGSGESASSGRMPGTTRAASIRPSQ